MFAGSPYASTPYAGSSSTIPIPQIYVLLPSIFGTGVVGALSAGNFIQINLPSIHATGYVGNFTIEKYTNLPAIYGTGYLGNFAIQSVISFPSIFATGYVGNVGVHQYSNLASISANGYVGHFAIQTSATGLRMSNLKVSSNIPDYNTNEIDLRISYDRGYTFGSPLTQTLGTEGQYYRNISYRRLGIGRDVIFEISLTSDSLLSMTGVFISTSPAST